MAARINTTFFGFKVGKVTKLPKGAILVECAWPILERDYNDAPQFGCAHFEISFPREIDGEVPKGDFIAVGLCPKCEEKFSMGVQIFDKETRRELIYDEDMVNRYEEAKARKG